MKRLIFGIALFFTGTAGWMGIVLTDNEQFKTGAFALLILLAVFGFCVAFWEALCAGRWARYWHAEVTLDVLVDGKKVGKLPAQQCTRVDEASEQAKAMESVQEALRGQHIQDRRYVRGVSIDLRTHW